jgi:glycine C-acetyltransferase
MTRAHLAMLAAETKKLEQAGLYRPEVVHIPSKNLVDFTSQDYLGLARDRRLVDAAKAALDLYGLGTGARAFAGTRQIHLELEQALARFLDVPAAIVFGSGYLANLAVYEALFDSRDCLFCDALVHPSTAEGVRLSSATTFPYRNADLEDLEDKLRRSRSARFRAVVTDGVFPFDGKVAELGGLCELAARYEAMVVVDDSLGVGVLGATGRGTRELRNAMAQVDVVTGSLAKAIGAAAGGFVAGKREVVEWLRQKATPYLFSAALPPAIAATALKALDLLLRKETPLATLRARTSGVKAGLERKGFRVLGGDHPTLAVHVGGVVNLQKLVTALYERGVHVNGVCFPVVPEGEARVRLDVSALHTDDELQRTFAAFDQSGRGLGIL